MSDAGKTILWIVVAVAVVAVIIRLFVSAGHRRAAEARRFEAGEQRGRVAPPRVEPRASLQHRGQGRASLATPRVGAAGSGASGVGAAAVGAAAFTQDDDEDDLADAENPFAATQPMAVGTGSAETPTEERSTTVTENPASDPTDTTSTGSTAFDPETVDDADSPEAADTTEDVDGSDAARTGSSTPHESVTPPVATIDEPPKVEVPALADRDDVIGEGGTPAGDPGDHRGQPWATTPGQHGPGDSDQPADEGLDVDMAPHSHASDDVDETAEAVSPGNDTPRREEAEPAPDAAAAAFPDEDDTTAGHETTGESDPRGRQEAGTRRTSSFDEVVDGGFGLGSAAPIGDGAQPLGHAVKATRDGRSFVAPGDAGYDEVEPDVWFYNEDAARRAGFNRQGD